MGLIPYEAPRYKEMHAVVDLYVKNVNPTAIARQLGIKRAEVLHHIEEWRSTAAVSDVMQSRVEELIASMDLHYSKLITSAYEIIEEVDDLGRDTGKETMTRSQMLSQKRAALDLIAKLEKDRLDILQKSGLLEMDHLGDEIAEMEEQKALILKVLSEELCQHCRPKVMGRLAEALGGGKVHGK